MYDPIRWTTFAMFIYDKTGWNQYYYERPSQIGYYVTQNAVTSSLTLPQSGLPTAFDLDSIIGNTGRPMVSSGHAVNMFTLSIYFKIIM